ncbi:MAG: GYD domain-containing protein [Nitriliruptorales bacterium]|nr:GYD domain-containing protein [Nitriliruptorales bacterium]
MATYVALVNWTDQGVRDFRGTVDRADAVADVAQRLGGTQTALYWTVGPYDLVAISEFPDDETATAFALAVSSEGNVRTTSMRAFDADEMRTIIGKLG